jgi:hypothetical protein
MIKFCSTCKQYRFFWFFDSYYWIEGNKTFYECLRCRRKWKKERKDNENRLQREQELSKISAVKEFYSEFPYME